MNTVFGPRVHAQFKHVRPRIVSIGVKACEALPNLGQIERGVEGFFALTCLRQHPRIGGNDH